MSKVQPTVGYEYINKFYIFGEDVVQVHIWDTAGQDKFKSLSSNYFKRASGAILVFDLTNRESFENWKSWYEDLMNLGEEAVEVLLIGKT